MRKVTLMTDEIAAAAKGLRVNLSAQEFGAIINKNAVVDRLEKENAVLQAALTEANETIEGLRKDVQLWKTTAGDMSQEAEEKETYALEVGADATAQRERTP
jgi:hypothetical protein